MQRYIRFSEEQLHHIKKALIRYSSSGRRDGRRSTCECTEATPSRRTSTTFQESCLPHGGEMLRVPAAGEHHWRQGMWEAADVRHRLRKVILDHAPHAAVVQRLARNEARLRPVVVDPRNEVGEGCELVQRVVHGIQGSNNKLLRHISASLLCTDLAAFPYNCLTRVNVENRNPVLRKGVSDLLKLDRIELCISQGSIDPHCQLLLHCGRLRNLHHECGFLMAFRSS
mmetsp:Transcript_10455/g.23493  ORF Transcript_10455/g.23493 Transcript_10455/m.23493 type:complete len:227 (-) Transcript_10455:1000-1680(-)